MAGKQGIKDLDYYMAHPDELPDDPAMLDALALGTEVPATEVSDGDPADADQDAAKQVEKDATTGEAEAEGSTGTEDTAPILSKDGKHTIPYNVLSTERERRQAAERVKAELEQRVKELEQRMAGTSTAPVTETAELDAMDEDDLAQLISDFPAIAKIVEQNKRLENRLAQAESKFRSIEEQETAVARRSMQEQVDANPHLRYWQQNDPDRWAAAIEADKRLLEIPANQSLSPAERLAKAVSVVNLVMGEQELPPGWAPEVSTSQSDKRKSTATVADAVRKAVDQAGSKPRTLSEIPGGAIPASDPLSELESLSAAELARQMDKMTPDQISALLARAG